MAGPDRDAVLFKDCPDRLVGGGEPVGAFSDAEPPFGVGADHRVGVEIGTTGDMAVLDPADGGDGGQIGDGHASQRVGRLMHGSEYQAELCGVRGEGCLVTILEPLARCGSMRSNARPAAARMRSPAAATTAATGARGSAPAQLPTRGKTNPLVSSPSRNAIRNDTDSASTAPARPPLSAPTSPRATRRARASAAAISAPSCAPANQPIHSAAAASVPSGSARLASARQLSGFGFPPYPVLFTRTACGSPSLCSRSNTEVTCSRPTRPPCLAVMSRMPRSPRFTCRPTRRQSASRAGARGTLAESPEPRAWLAAAGSSDSTAAGPAKAPDDPRPTRISAQLAGSLPTPARPSAHPRSVACRRDDGPPCRPGSGASSSG